MVQVCNLKVTGTSAELGKLQFHDYSTTDFVDIFLARHFKRNQV